MQNDERRMQNQCAAFAHLRLREFLFCILILSVPGCSLIGAVAYKSTGPDQEPAKYVPGKTATMVVVAENWKNPAGSEVDTEQLTRYISDDLRDNNVAPQADPMKVIDLRSRDPRQFHAMTIGQIGQYAGAKQVLYVNVTQSSLSAPIGTELVRGGCTALVKVVDVDSGQTLWPPDLADGYPITVQTPAMQESADTDESSVRQSLQQLLAERISRLFYKHDVEDDEAGG